ncbi:phosphoenolpyruvate-protein phosphotransferase PtsI [Buchnera aphidicola (Neophyllaphis podocarpi)]|uniref:phosphoenolpyruvate-protein phosphotransferase PtsI n=1 Tax=Buchnera aphidicola TaxID=9 RepID=UPI0031B8355C
MISGILASPGIALGKALLLIEEKIQINKNTIPSKNIQIEIERFLKSRKKTSDQLKKIKKRTGEIFGQDKEDIFEGHIMLLEDQELEKEVKILIKEKNITADAAVYFIIEEQAQALEKLEDEYLKSRAIDIRDIGKRLLKNIKGIQIIDISEINEQVILIAKDLTPTETTQINKKNILGFITDMGGNTSHTSIIARSLEIPAIVGTKNITKKVKNGQLIALDAINNSIYIKPNKNLIKNINLLKQEYKYKKNKLLDKKNIPAITQDGKKIIIGANVGNIKDIEIAKNSGADFIGLYRTEFLFMDRTSLPSEEEQFLAYKKATEIFKNKTIIIRTMDIGGDKNLPYMNLPKEENPFLGWRAIRICMDKREILGTQLRAILRASAFGKIKIMFPMIISIEEIKVLNLEINKIKKDLEKEEKNFNKNIKIGIMIETPAAAIISNHLSKEVNFFSIGTNDLTQYTLAVDRGNDLISNLYNPMSPAVLQLIYKIIKNSHINGITTSMCGELAGDKCATMLLIGMGLDSFSMNSSVIPEIKNIIRNTNFERAKTIANKILLKSTYKEILDLIKYKK